MLPEHVYASYELCDRVDEVIIVWYIFEPSPSPDGAPVVSRGSRKTIIHCGWI